MERINNKSNEKSYLLRKVLLGTQFLSRLPEMQIGRWNVYKMEPIKDYPPGEQTYVKSINYEIVGEIVNDKREKILIRFLLNDADEIYKTKYYYLLSSTDPELAFLLTQALLSRINEIFPLSFDYEIKRFQF